MNASMFIPLIIAVLMAAVVTVAFGYPYLQAKLAVIFAGGFVFVLSVVQLVKEYGNRKRQTKIPAPDRQEAADDGSGGQYAIELAWMAGFALTVYLFGFMIAIPLYTCAYMKLHGSRWPASIMTGGGMAAFCYIIFVLILEKRLPAGIIVMRLGL